MPRAEANTRPTIGCSDVEWLGWHASDSRTTTSERRPRSSDTVSGASDTAHRPILRFKKSILRLQMSLGRGMGAWPRLQMSLGRGMAAKVPRSGPQNVRELRKGILASGKAS
jgi:hypothetical protein